MEENRISYSGLETRAFNQKAVLSPKNKQKPTVNGQKAPARSMFVPTTARQQFERKNFSARKIQNWWRRTRGIELS